jgi:PAS domain S-box-containing protein
VIAIFLKIAIDDGGSQEMSPFIPGIAAVIVSALWTGPGPGAACTIFFAIYAVTDLQGHHIAPGHILIRCMSFVIEGFVLCFWTAGMMRSARDAANSEAWHRQLVETASEGIWVRDSSGVITYANARMAEMLGVGVAELVGRKAEAFFFPADLSVERIRSETMTTGLKEQFDRRLRCADGSELWVLTCGNPMPATEGSAPSALAMMSDITERKRAETALRQSEERFRSLFETVPEGVYQSAPDGRILAANPMLLKMFGFAREAELSDVNITRDLYVDPGVRKRLLERLEREDSFQNVEYELHARDGRIISILENARVVRDPSGAVLYYEGTLIDITSRKRMEDQLRQAQKVEAMGRLAGGIARDFNTVLNVIVAHVHAALRELPASHPARSETERALLAAGNARELTGQLLSFSRRPGEMNAEAAFPLKGDGESILLVDDEPLVRELSRDMLERQGYRVTLATDGAEALRIDSERTGENRFDLLITDISTPDMTGSELAKRMRSAHPALKVLFISGYSDPPLEREDLSGDDSAFMQKPFSADALGRKIRQMLGA